MRQRARPSPRTLAALISLLAALLVVPLALAPRAEAYVYWTQSSANNNGIGRANLNGTGVERRFIQQQERTVNDFALNDTHIYWTYYGMDTMGRSNLDGTGVVADLFRAPGALFCFPRGGCASVSLALDSDHIYWTTLRGNPPMGGIGRSKLDGTGVDADFISGISPGLLGPLAVDRDYIYWTNFGPGTIGRAKLDGTAVDESFISRAYAVDVAVDRDYIYWTGFFDPAGTIGRARIDGTGVEQRFITPNGDPAGVAVDDKHLYWTEYDGATNTDAISRAKLDGTDVQRAFIDRIRSGFAIAVDGLGPPGKATANPTQRQKGKKIVVKVKVKARERLTAKASGKIKVNPTYKLRPKKVQVAAGKTKTMKLKPKKAARKITAALKRGEKAKARLSVRLTDQAGNTETEKLRVRLKRG